MRTLRGVWRTAGAAGRQRTRRLTTRSLRAIVAALLALAASSLVTSPLAAQRATSVVTGTVKDTVGRPIVLAGVQLDESGDWHGVTAEGEFRVLGVSAGVHVFRVRALGYASMSADLTLTGTDTVAVDVVLTRAATVLDTVHTLAAAAGSTSYGPAEFQERRRTGRGSYLTRDQFEKHAPTRLSDLLVQLPGVQRKPVESPSGTTEYVLVMRGVSTVHGEVCPVNVYLDGRNFPVDAIGLDGIARPLEIDAIEVYPGSSQVPLRFAGPTARCGVIALWSRASGR